MFFDIEKDNDDKKFEIFTDPDSQIKHYKKLIGALVIIAFFSMSIIVSSFDLPPGSRGPYLLKGPYVLNLSIPLIFNPLIVLASTVTCIKYIKRIQRLHKEKNV